MFSEDDLLPLSALQHLAFCPRQCALIHLEGAWAENRLTAEGRVLHNRVHESGLESRPGIRVARGLRLHSLCLGLVGQADVVEFLACDPTASDLRHAVELPGQPGRWCPQPVEYKRGRPKRDPVDEVQLCAQALCLEEMLSVSIPSGAIFYGQTRRRLTVPLDFGLRSQTEALAARLHELVQTAITPPPTFGPHCEKCSLRAYCLPEPLAHWSSIQSYLEQNTAL